MVTLGQRLTVLGLAAAVSIASSLVLCGGLADPQGTKKKTKPADTAPKATKWEELVAVDDLVADLTTTADTIAQNLKTQRDFDRFLKEIKSHGHLIAVYAAILNEHADADGWRPASGTLQSHAIEIAKAAESKGFKSYKSAQTAHKALKEAIKAGPKKGTAGDARTTDWTTIASLADVMKRVDASYKKIRGASNAAALAKGAKEITHDAAILAALSEVAPKYKADDKVFAELSIAMRIAAVDATNAAKDVNFDAAQAATTAINDACNKCHAKYRLDQKGFDF